VLLFLLRSSSNIASTILRSTAVGDEKQTEEIDLTQTKLISAVHKYMQGGPKNLAQFFLRLNFIKY